MFGLQDQSFATRVEMEIIEFRLPRFLVFDLHGVAGRLPKAPFAVVTGPLRQDLGEASWHVPLAKVGQLTASEFSEIGHDIFQRFGLKSLVKKDAMKMRGHDHVGIDAQPFLALAEVETLGHDLASRLRDE